MGYAVGNHFAGFMLFFYQKTGYSLTA